MAGDDPEPTIFIPGGTLLPGETPAPDPAVASAPVPSPSAAQSIKVGDVLNHLYEVRRLIARGGMGEVFEGANVNYSDERVAIKVILPHLAADPAVQGMFYKEARTLTRLTHPALVQYRTMAQEPQLGVFYIVTEFVDGPNLSDRLRDLQADARQIASLTRRLAEGLAVAHAMGAIHRDISPDNILLEGGSVERAKIIDFGIAKDLDPSAATIVGDGFAGKLSYVAPEQLGESGGEIGPWTDVYSLGLTILAVARGRDVDMGGTIVDAVDKRRAGPDLSAVPASLRPLIARMVAANPRDRLRSMDEVIQWLNDPAQRKEPDLPGRARGWLANGLEHARAALGKVRIPSRLGEPRTLAIAGGGALGLLVLGAAVFSFTGGGETGTLPGTEATTKGPPRAIVADPLAVTRSVLASGLSGVACSWLDIEAVEGGGGQPISVSLKGVSGQLSQSIAQIEGMLKAAGVGAVSVNYADIAPVPANFCPPIEAFARVRGGGGLQLSVPQTKFEMAPLEGNLPKQYIGQLGATAVIDIDLKGAAQMPVVIGVGESGEMQLLFENLRKAQESFLSDLGNGRFRLNLPTTSPGWSGIVLLTGKGPFRPALFNHQPGTIDAQWPQQFADAAQQGGWKAEMVWYKVVNEQPDATRLK